MSLIEPKICFGGSFNPIHLGHLQCAKAVAITLGIAKVMLIPSGQPPHKPNDPTLAPGEHRLAMCRLAAQVDPIFEVSDIELQRTGPCYTADTVEELKRAGWSIVHWLIGADMLRLLPNWHRAEFLLQEVRFIIVARPGWEIDWSSLPPRFQSLQFQLVNAPLIDISATDIRQKVKQGQDISDLVPQSVSDYIRIHGLYR